MFTFTNQFSKKTQVDFVAHQLETLIKFEEFQCLIESNSIKKEGGIISDKGIEYTLQTFVDYYKHHDIHTKLIIVITMSLK